MRRNSKVGHWTRCALAAGIATMVGCGGGGGGADSNDDGTGDDPAPTMPTDLRFTGGLIDGVPMVVSAAGVNVSVSRFGFDGTWDRAANRYTLPANGTYLNVDLGAAGTLEVGVPGAAAWVGSVPPAESGTVSAKALVGSLGTPLFTGIASMTVLSDTAVQLSWDGTVPPTTLDYGWDAFLNDDLPTDWASGIQAGVGVLTLGVEKVQFALDQFLFVNAYDAQLLSAGAAGVTQACAGGVGTRKVVWNDANGDSALGPADSFSVTFAGCRIDMPGDIDQVLNGQIVISDYIENIGNFWVGGRVDFIGLQQTETDAGAVPVSTTGSIQLSISPN